MLQGRYDLSKKDQMKALVEESVKVSKSPLYPRSLALLMLYLYISDWYEAY